MVNLKEIENQAQECAAFYPHLMTSDLKAALDASGVTGYRCIPFAQKGNVLPEGTPVPDVPLSPSGPGKRKDTRPSVLVSRLDPEKFREAWARIQSDPDIRRIRENNNQDAIQYALREARRMERNAEERGL